MDSEQKNRQLEYIKGHGKWLSILTIISLLTFAFIVCGVIQVTRWKRNYTELHKQVDELEYKYGKMVRE